MSHVSEYHSIYDNYRMQKDVKRGYNSVKKILFFEKKKQFFFCLIEILLKDFYDEKKVRGGGK